MLYLVTGGAGFIGSNIVASLVQRGDEVAVCDWLGRDDKWKNIAKHDLYDIFPPEKLPAWLDAHEGKLAGVAHMGAISSTTERDADLIVANNYELSRRLWSWCAATDCVYVYASSAATYGDGAAGFEDRFETQAMQRLRPLNAYGWSKHTFDRWVLRAVTREEAAPPRWAGLKFFNVYGPNEYHKGEMRSVVAQNHPKIVAGEPVRLFRSYRPEYPDGGQMRDFIYVKDCVGVVVEMLSKPFPSSLYNVGTGKARSWLDLARALFAAAGLPERIEFIDMPPTLRDRYQYFTQAQMEKTRKAGFLTQPTSLEDGIADYVRGYLGTDDPYR